MAMNPFETMNFNDVKRDPTYPDPSEQSQVTIETAQSVVTAETMATSAQPPVTAVTPESVEAKRKMWQIFTDETGEVQRKSYTIDPSNHQQEHNEPEGGGQNTLQAEQESLLPQAEKQHVSRLFDSVHGVANPNARTPNGDVNFQMAPPKPPRRVEIIPKSNGSVADTVVFQKDTTYTKFGTIEVDSDEELFGDGQSAQKTAEENHYVGNKVLIRSESDLDILLTSPRKRIWLANSKWCCVHLYKWPMAKSYGRVVVAGLAMVVLYVCVVLITVHAMN